MKMLKKTMSIEEIELVHFNKGTTIEKILREGHELIVPIKEENQGLIIKQDPQELDRPTYILTLKSKQERKYFSISEETILGVFFDIHFLMTTIEAWKKQREETLEVK